MPAIGAGLSQPPFALVKTADAFTQKYFSPIVADAVFKPSPTWWRLLRRGRKLHGGAIVWPVLAEEVTGGGAYWGAQILDTTIYDTVRPAQLEWKAYYQPIVIPYTDLVLNSGPTQVVNLIKEKEEEAMANLLQKLSRALFKVPPQNTAQDLDSLVDAVASDANVYAGIDRATNAFWKPFVRTTAEAISDAALQTVYNAIVYGNEEPDTIITTHAGFNNFRALLVGNIRYPDPDQETIRAGFRRHLVFNNAVVVQDRWVADSPTVAMYFLNTRYIDVHFHEREYFVVDPFVRPHNQRVLISGVYVMLNLQVRNPRLQGAHTGLTND